MTRDDLATVLVLFGLVALCAGVFLAAGVAVGLMVTGAVMAALGFAGLSGHGGKGGG